MNASSRYYQKHRKELIAASVQYRKKHKDKTNEAARKYRRVHKIEVNERNRWRKLLIRHGITKDQYEQLFRSQDGKCAICRTELNKKLAVDHDHKTNMIRGLLCHKCNMALGILEDRVDAMIEYLNKPTTIKWLGIGRVK